MKYYLEFINDRSVSVIVGIRHKNVISTWTGYDERPLRIEDAQDQIYNLKEIRKILIYINCNKDKNYYPHDPSNKRKIQIKVYNP